MPDTRTIGQFPVSPLGYGAMPLSMGGNVRPSPEQAIATVQAALESGITLIDTADIYAPSWDTIGHNERLLARAFRELGGRPDGVVVATKGGITRGEGETWGRDGSPEHLRSAVRRSMEALEVEAIDLYYWHRPDRGRLYAEVIETFAALRQNGLIREIGISNANIEEIQVAIDVLGEGGLAAVQNEFSPSFHHTSRPEMEFCAEHGIAFLAWSPLGGTHGGATSIGQRFPVIAEIARAHEVSPQRVTLAWELSLGDHVVPIPGASRPESIRDSAQAMNLSLTQEELARISADVFRQ